MFNGNTTKGVHLMYKLIDDVPKKKLFAVLHHFFFYEHSKKLWMIRLQIGVATVTLTASFLADGYEGQLAHLDPLFKRYVIGLSLSFGAVVTCYSSFSSRENIPSLRLDVHASLHSFINPFVEPVAKNDYLVGTK